VIYLFHGSDVNKVRAKAFLWVAATHAKAPDAYYTRLDADATSAESLQEALMAQGLFFSKTLVLVDDPFSNTEAGEALLDSLEALAASPNAVAILAPKLLAARLKKIEPHAPPAAKGIEVNPPEKKAVRGFNSGLVNALAEKNGPKLWQEIEKAYRLGDAPEMIHGLLHWKARDLMQKGSRTWRGNEARNLSRSLIELLSDSRSGDLSLNLALERFALSL
jgi:DNA polymerase III delta subunit